MGVQENRTGERALARPGRITLLWEQIFASKSALAGFIIVMFFLALVVFGQFIYGYSPTRMNIPQALKPPSLSHPFGTDSLGRDVFTRILFGARISMLISICGVLSAALIGIGFGLISGYYGGWIDDILMRICDFLFAFPSYVLALLLMVALGFGITNVMFAICLVYIPIFARLMRGLTQSIKSEQFVEANITLGMNDFKVMFIEILPNGIGPIIVQATIGMAYAVILEAALSFLGLGVQPPSPSLGTVLADGKEYLRMAPWIVGMSGAVISVMLLGFNLLGDGIRDYMDPKLARQIR
ncbi:MAG: ABC transporter permease [Thermodesulfobacteriota bacterium]